MKFSCLASNNDKHINYLGNCFLIKQKNDHEMGVINIMWEMWKIVCKKKNPSYAPCFSAEVQKEVVFQNKSNNKN